MAVLMPMTQPLVSKSGPPLFPCAWGEGGEDRRSAVCVCMFPAEGRRCFPKQGRKGGQQCGCEARLEELSVLPEQLLRGTHPSLKRSPRLTGLMAASVWITSWMWSQVEVWKH